MLLNSIKKESDSSNNTSSQHQSINQASIRQAQASSQFNEALTEMKEISKSSYDSAKNMEKLTVIIAALTITSVVISIMSLAINSADVVAPAAPTIMINVAWGIAIFTTYYCLYTVIIILKRGEYVPINPHLSHIKRYKKYCWSRLKVSIGIYGSLDVLGIIFGTLSIITLTDSENISAIMNNYWFILPTIYLVILSVIVIGFGIMKGYHIHFVYFSGVIPLIIMTFIAIGYVYTISVLQCPLVVSLLIYWIGVFLVSLYYLTKMVTLFVDCNTTLDDWYEYESDKAHTGIVVIMNPHHFGYLADDGVKRLAKHYMNDLKQPYRVYFCFRKEHVRNILEKDTVSDILMFGSFHKRGNPIYSKMDYIDSGLADSKFHGKTFDQMLYSKKNVKSLIHHWEKEQDSLED